MQVISDFFSQDQLDYLLSLPEIQSAFINEKQHTFNIEIPDDVLTTLNSKLNLNLCSPIPARLIVGDTPAHIDSGATPFDNTYLIYLNDAEGEFIIDGHSHSISANTAFKFAEGMSHEVKSTNGSKRLLLGPMNEIGQPVGGSTRISADGQTETIYFSYISSGPSTGLFYRINNGLLNGVSLPIRINNTNTPYTLKVLFETDIVIGSDITYFIAESDNIQFGSTSLNPNGTRPTITISSVLNYPGLIDNGSGGTGYNAIRVLNLQMTSTGTSTLINGSGWIGQNLFGAGATGNLIINCSTDATLGIPSLSGGIVGGSAGSGFGARLEIIGCTSAGAIQGSSGGIAGQFAGQNRGRIIVSQCSSSGSSYGGGIFGAYAGAYAGTAIAGGCYSTGLINSGGSGGIFAQYAARVQFPNPGDTGTATAINCYSRGNILADCGGIFGQYADVGATANQCYSSGVISSGGGIFGTNYLGTANNCYTSGRNPVSATSGIYAGSSNDNASGTNNYSEANNGNLGAWNTDNATDRLGSAWLSLGDITPFIFSQIGYTPYQVTNMSFDASGNPFITNFASNVVVGGTTEAAILAGGTYDLLNSPPSNFTINGTTGSITVATDTTPGTYTLTVRFSTNPYSVTTYTLTVISVQVTTTQCCGSLAGQSNLDYATIFQVKGGNAMIADASNPRNKITSYQDMVRLKTALAFSR